MQDIIFIDRHFTDLNPLIAGEEQCVPGHTFGPHVRDYTLIHFVVSGKGILMRGDETYEVHAGEAFIILPGEVTTYRADNDDPWFYQWVGFTGRLTERFSQLSPVLPYRKNYVEEMLSSYENDGVGEWRITALLFEMCASFFSVPKPQNHYVRRVETYINTMYMQSIRVEEIAERMNLDRRYLSRLFKQKTGCTVQEYIIQVRIEAAKRQLESGVSVFEAARRSGYEDVCNFSKIFKRETGISPGKWKKTE